jgi:hypothetical protein
VDPHHQGGEHQRRLIGDFLKRRLDILIFPIRESNSNHTLQNGTSRRTDWLKADCDFPSLAAARVKLRASATAAKIARSLSSSFAFRILTDNFMRDYHSNRLHAATPSAHHITDGQRR